MSDDAEEGLPGFQALVLGETESLPEQESNTVRIFMSSTFTDMKEERNKLIQEVFPELRRYCQQRRLEFEVVDMRWGVRDSATADHLTSLLCLNEIDRCKRMSQGPYFVGFLGDKYGYRPLKASIETETFRKLMDIVSQADTVNQEDVDLIRQWYIEDTNAIPAVYVLQPITALLPDYYDSSDSQRQRATRQTWWEIFERMRKVFDLSAQMAVEAGVYSSEEMHTFVMSVTEEEIRHGLQGNTHIQDTCLIFMRDFQDLQPSFEQRDTMSKFTDLQTDKDEKTVELMEHPQTLLLRLKTEFIPSVVPAESLHRFTVPWSQKGLDPRGHPEHADYLNQMCEVFERRMKAMIDKKLEGQRSKGVVDPMRSILYRELLHHASFCKTKCSAFQGRRDILTSIKSFLSVSSNHHKPLVVHGVSGSGKTSVMAMVAKQAREWIGPGCVTVLRFLGTSAQSTSIHATLQSMCRQICLAYNVQQPPNDHLDDFSELVQVFNSVIRNLPTKDKPLLLLFDSIDQLNSNNNAHKMNWLAKTLPDNTFIVVSMLPVEHNCLDNIKMTLKDPECYIAMKEVPKENGIAIMDGWLKGRGRKLTEEQTNVVTEAFSKCPQPLFLKLLFEEFVTWPSYKVVKDIKLPSTVVEAITNLFQELEDCHGHIFVVHTLGYLTAGKSGLTEAEIEDVLSCDDQVLNDVYQYWDPPVEGVVRIPSSVWKRLRYDISEFVVERQSGGKTVITWYHRQFIETATSCYLGDIDAKQARHQILADMFLGEYSRGKIKPIRLERRNKDYPNADRLAAPQPLMFGDSVFNRRKLQELPYHLMRCKRVDNTPEGLVQHILYNFEWNLTKLRAFNFLELINDYEEFDEESKIMIDTLYLSGSNIKEDPFSLAGQLIGRTSDLVDKYLNIARLLDGAKAWVQSTNHPLIIPRGACLIPPGGHLKTSLAGHPSRVEAIACTSSGNVLVTVCKDSNGQPMANVWDAAKTELIHTLQVKAGHKAPGTLSLAISHDDKYVVFGCQMLGMFELTGGECIWKLETGEDHAVSSLQIHHDGTLAIAGSEKGSHVLVWDLQSGNLLAKLEHPENVKFVFFESNTELLSVCQDGFIRHWSIKPKECVHAFQAHNKDDVKAVGYAHSIKTVVSGDSNGTIKLSGYRDKPSSPQKSLEGHKKAISCLLVLSDNLLASGSADFTIRIWDMVEGTAVMQCQGHAGLITCLWHGRSDPSEPRARSILVSGSKDDLLKVWDLDPKDVSNPLITTLEGHSSWIADVTGCQPETIYTASNDKSAKVWDYTRETVIKRERHKGLPYIDAITFSPDKTTVITSGEEQNVKFSSFYDCRVTRREKGYAKHLLPSQDGKKLIGALTVEGVLRVWDMDQSVDDGGSVFDLEGHQKGILCMHLGHGDEVVTGSQDMTLKVWSVGKSMCMRTLEGHDGGVELVKVAVQEADTFIVSADSKGTLKVWRYNTGECLLSANGHQSKIICMDISSDAQYAVTGGNDHEVVLWSLQADSFGQVVKRLTIHTMDVICLGFTGDGTRVISGSHAGKRQLHVWNFLEEDDTKDHFLTGHHHAIMNLHLSSDDQYLFTASRDCTLKVWHLPSRQMRASFDNKSQIKHFDVAFISEDLFRIAAENKTGTILLLDLFLPKADRSGVRIQTSSHLTTDLLTTANQSGGSQNGTKKYATLNSQSEASLKGASGSLIDRKEKSTVCMLF